MTFIATFYSHFGAIRYQRLCQSKGYKAQTMPVPRNLSSSCGTCVKYEAPEMLEDPTHDEIEQIVLCKEDGYECLFRAENS
ncbi:MAG: DUF3343 domain-containing protein [Firmicutes bacterium]|nr:DUF3343 domain-containing protein [Bacillota bacterium]